MNQIALSGKAVAHLRYRITLLNLLVRVSTLVREFYDELCHFAVGLRAVSDALPLGSV